MITVHVTQKWNKLYCYGIYYGSVSTLMSQYLFRLKDAVVFLNIRDQSRVLYTDHEVYIRLLNKLTKEIK